jgi:hypothetical protein
MLLAYFALLDMANILPITRDEVDEAIRSPASPPVCLTPRRSRVLTQLPRWLAERTRPQRSAGRRGAPGPQERRALRSARLTTLAA